MHHPEYNWQWFHVRRTIALYAQSQSYESECVPREHRRSSQQQPEANGTTRAPLQDCTDGMVTATVTDVTKEEEDDVKEEKEKAKLGLEISTEEKNENDHRMRIDDDDDLDDNDEFDDVELDDVELDDDFYDEDEEGEEEVQRSDDHTTTHAHIGADAFPSTPPTSFGERDIAATTHESKEGSACESVLSVWYQLLLSDARGRLAAVRRSKESCSKMAKSLPKTASSSSILLMTNDAGSQEPSQDGGGGGGTTAATALSQHAAAAAAAVGAASTRLFSELDNSLNDEEDSLEAYVEKLQKMMKDTIDNASAEVVEAAEANGNTAQEHDTSGEDSLPVDASQVVAKPALAVGKTSASQQAAAEARTTLQSIVALAEEGHKVKSVLDIPTPLSSTQPLPKREKTPTPQHPSRSSQYTHEDYLKLFGFDALLNDDEAHVES